MNIPMKVFNICEVKYFWCKFEIFHELGISNFTVIYNYDKVGIILKIIFLLKLNFPFEANVVIYINNTNSPLIIIRNMMNENELLNIKKS